jgi:hypothetical protein
VKSTNDRRSLGDRESFTGNCGAQGEGTGAHPPAALAVTGHGEKGRRTDSDAYLSTAALTFPR